jgi:hypothetical protein
MNNRSRNGVVGAALIGLGCGLTAIGVALVIPVCTSWSLSLLDQVYKKGREGVDTASTLIGDLAGKAGEFAGKAHTRFDEAAKTAKQTTSKAAAAVENAARYVRQTTAG